VLLLCGGIVVGAGLLVRGMNVKAPLAIPATVTQISAQTAAPVLTNAPTQLVPPTQAPPPALPPTSTPTSEPSPTPAPTEFKVLWDISHGPRASEDGSLYTPDGMYSLLKQALANNKFVISSGDLSNLNAYSMLVLSEVSAVKSPYTSSDADAIEQFVRVSGHSLLILSDMPGFGNHIDAVSRRFSIGLGNITSDGPASYSNEPFFSGVNSVMFLFGGGALKVSSPAQTAAVDKGGNSVIAFCECDAGRLLVIADANLWDNRGLNQADNQRFATDVFQWLAKLSP